MEDQKSLLDKELETFYSSKKVINRLDIFVYLVWHIPFAIFMARLPFFDNIVGLESIGAHSQFQNLTGKNVYILQYVSLVTILYSIIIFFYTKSYMHENLRIHRKYMSDFEIDKINKKAILVLSLLVLLGIGVQFFRSYESNFNLASAKPGFVLILGHVGLACVGLGMRVLGLAIYRRYLMRQSREL